MPRVGPAAAVGGPPPQQQPSISGLQAAPPLAVSCLSDLVELNVWGTLFTTNRATLEESQPQSMLAALVSGRHGLPRRDAQVRGEAKARSASKGEASKGEGRVRVAKGHAPLAA